MNIKFRSYSKDDYLKVCDFLVKVSNKNKKHINWNWARWSWMIYHGDKGHLPLDEVTVANHKNTLSAPLNDWNLNVFARDGETWVGFCGCWYDKNTDYAYVEPVCVIPKYRRKGIGEAVVVENLRRCKALEAKKAYVISDSEFYKKIGFTQYSHYTFYWYKK